MIISVILSPNVLASELDEHLSKALYDVIKAIGQNGIIVDGKNNDLLKQLAQNISNVAIKYQQYVSIWIQEFLKNNHIPYRVFKCSSETCVSSDKCSDASEQCLNNVYDVDVIVTRQTLQTSKNVVDLEDYAFSNIEKTRCDYLNNQISFNRLTDSEKEICWKRILQFTNHLSIYDPYIGAAISNAGFSATIKYIIGLWKRYCVYSKKLSLEITTKIGEYDFRDTREIILNHVLNNISQRLKIYVYVKNDPNKIFHARYLKTNHRIFSCDPGFDFFDGEVFRPTTIRIDSGAYDNFCQYRRLEQVGKFEYPN